MNKQALQDELDTELERIRLMEHQIETIGHQLANSRDKVQILMCKIQGGRHERVLWYRVAAC